MEKEGKNKLTKLEIIAGGVGSFVGMLMYCSLHPGQDTGVIFTGSVISGLLVNYVMNKHYDETDKYL